MATEIEKLIRAREILNMIIQGENPFSHELIEEECFIHNPKMIRCLCYINEVLTRDIEKQKKNTYRKDLLITEEDMKKVIFPKEDLGIRDFVNAVNSVLDIEHRKGLTTNKFTHIMKNHQMLGEKVEEGGRRRTVCNESSIQYGFYMGQGMYNGVTYERVMINEKGKEYLRENLVRLLYENKRI